jgi:hypothetical protein
LVLVVLVSVSAVLVAPRLCGVTEPQRHGLACDIPLPPNTTFDREVVSPAGAVPGVSTQNLQYHVSNTANDAIKAFYAQQLPGKGWKCVSTEVPLIISAQQGNRGLAVIVAPSDGTSGDVTMIVSVTTFAKDLDITSC